MNTRKKHVSMISYSEIHIKIWFSLVYVGNGSPLVQHDPSVLHISSTQKGHSFAAPRIRQFNTKKASFQHKCVRSINPLVQHKKRLFNTKVSVWQKWLYLSELNSFCETDAFCVKVTFFVFNWRFFVLNWQLCWSESFLCWTDVFYVLN